jgi:hypothetical protein
LTDEDFKIFLEDFTAYVCDIEEAISKALGAVRKLKSQIAKLVELLRTRAHNLKVTLVLSHEGLNKEGA